MNEQHEKRAQITDSCNLQVKTRRSQIFVEIYYFFSFHDETIKCFALMSKQGDPCSTIYTLLR